MNWKSFVSAYLSFSRKDRLGVLMLLLLIILIYVLPYLVPAKVQPPHVMDDSLQIWSDSIQPTMAAGYRSLKAGEPFDFSPEPAKSEPEYDRATLFYFDPNTLDASGWAKLGLGDRTIKTILNYRSKGGRFYKPEDLRKIWGLPGGFYQHVAKYIKISDIKFQKQQLDKMEYTPNLKQYTHKTIDINIADTSVWISLPGIGSKLANRIVNFRNKLGGFVSIDQVGTTYGLPDSTFQKIRPMLSNSTSSIIKLKINQATQAELTAHPYIKYEVAKAIVAFREQNGLFNGPDDLRKVMLLDENTLSKLLPYLQFE